MEEGEEAEEAGRWSGNAHLVVGMGELPGEASMAWRGGCVSPTSL